MRGRDDFNVTSNAVRQAVGVRCHVKSFIIHNDDTAARFVAVYNALAANVTVGTTVPDMLYQVAANDVLPLDLGDAEYSLGFSYGITTTDPAGGTTGPTSCWVHVSYL